MKIDVSQAAITTAQVEIRVLTVNNKQMTLAVFRQLPEERIVGAYDYRSGFEINGKPWGWVNYHWRGCDEDLKFAYRSARFGPPEHRHMVWEKEGALFRTLVEHWSKLLVVTHNPHENCLWLHIDTELTDGQIAAMSTAFTKLWKAPQLFIAV